MSVKLAQVVDLLDAELRIGDFQDVSHNGLQVANGGSVSRICCGVDASMEFFRAARRKGADMCIVHHGISWGDSLSRITGVNYDIVSFLIANDIALYAAHLPLDAHPELGNNACIAAKLGVADKQPFGRYQGQDIGWMGKLPAPMEFDALCSLVRKIAGGDGNMQPLPYGRGRVRTVGIASGGAADCLGEAAEKGLDCLITGEANLQAYNEARHLRINMIAAGHYATERFGVEAAGNFLAARLGIPSAFVNLRLPW